MIPLVAPCYTEQDSVTAIAENDIQVRAFEEEFATYVGCAGAVAVNSGTSALMVALRALGAWNVVFPSYTCRAILDAVDAIAGEDGHRPYTLIDNVCDVPNANFTMIGPRSRDYDVVILPHMFGRAAIADGFDPIHDLTLSLGADPVWLSPKFMGVCSFYRDKMISTGRGGMVVSNDEAFLVECRKLAHYETAMDGFHYMPAFSFGMTGMQAALGRSQLRQLPKFIERRQQIASRYTASFQAAGIETPDPEVASVFFRYIVGVEDPAVKVAELEKRGIEAGRGVFPALHQLLGLDPADFPGAEQCVASLLSIPVHPSLSDEQVDYITEQVLQVCAP